MAWQDYVEQRADVLCGKPVFRGTRISIQSIIEDFAAGATQADLLRSYPTLTQAHLQAALQYAAWRAGSDPDRAA